MKKLLLLLVASLSMMILTACGTPKYESKTTEYNETFVDTENITVEIESISSVIDEEWDAAYHEVIMNIENKSDHTLNIQAGDVKIDGLDVSDKTFFMAELESGESLHDELVINFYEEELPPLEEQFEFVFLGFDTEEYSTIVEEKIVVSIK